MYLITLFEDMGKIFVKYWDLFLIKGLSATILLSLMTVVFGTVLGAVFALIKIGKIKALKKGSCTIKVTTTDGSKITKKIKVTVK